jgi:hypothetical protein
MTYLPEKPDNGQPAGNERAAYTDLEISVLRSDDGPLSKRIYLEEGEMRSDSSECFMSRGAARRVTLPGGAKDLARVISELGPSEALVLGQMAIAAGDNANVVTKRMLTSGTTETRAISRTRDYFDYRPGRPAVMLLDFDLKGIPEEIKHRVTDAGGLFKALLTVAPELASAARVSRASTSSGISNSETGEQFDGSGGEHHFLLIKDGADIDRTMCLLHDRLWLAGFGWYRLGASGQLLERSLIDKSVRSPERLVFEAAPLVAAPLQQDQTARASGP